MNLWYLDDGSLNDDYRTVLKALKKLLMRKKRWDSKLNLRNAKFFSLVTSLKMTITNRSENIARDQNAKKR